MGANIDTSIPAHWEITGGCNARTNVSIIREKVKKQRDLSVIPAVGNICLRNKYECNTPVIMTYRTAYVLRKKYRSDILCILPFPSCRKQKAHCNSKERRYRDLSDTLLKEIRDFGKVIIRTQTANCYRA